MPSFLHILASPEKRVAAVATDAAVGSAADVAFGHLATDVIFRSIGVEVCHVSRRLRRSVLT